MSSVPRHNLSAATRQGTDPLRPSHAMRAVTCVVALGGAMLLAGCASSEFGAAEAPVLPSAYADAERPLVRRDLKSWWRSFGDPTLDRLVARAGSDNLTLAQARARLTAGRAQTAAAQSLFLPTLGAGSTAIAATPKTENSDPLRRPLMAGFDMSWDVGLFGLSENTARAADASEAILAADLEAVRVVMTAEVASAYISLRSVQQQQAITAVLVATQRRRIEALRALVRIGLATAGEEADLTLALAEAEADQANLEARAKGLQQQIATLLGTPAPDAALARVDEQPLSAHMPDVGRPADLLRARPDVRAAEQKVLHAGAEVGIAQAGLYPRLRLVGTIGVGAPFTSSPFGVAGGPILEIPLLDYGRRQAAVSAQLALYDEAVAAYRQTVLMAYQEAATAQANWSASLKATHQQRDSLEAAERKNREVRVLQREGLADRSRMGEVEAALIERRRRLVLARETEALSVVVLYKALGGAGLPRAPVTGQR